MKKIIIVSACLLVIGAALYLTNMLGLLCPGGISGNSKFPSMEERARKARKYAMRKRLDSTYCLILDYGIPSGQPRLFVWSFKENKVVYSTHAMHGTGGGSTDQTPVFSNRPGSNCSSLGRFEVTGDRGEMNKNGLRLRGLEPSNSLAYSRGLMIHSARWVDRHKRKEYIPLNELCSQGCVTVSPSAMTYINKLANKVDSHLLLWTYYTVPS